MTNKSSSLKVDLSLDTTEVNNIIVIYTTVLFLLAYILSLLVSYLHFRTTAVVFPLSAPETATQFTEYIIMVKTSLHLGASLSSRGRVTLQLKGSFDDSPALILRKGKHVDYFLCRGGVNIFVYHSPTDLGDILEAEFELFNDAPYERPTVQWRPAYLKVLQPITKRFWGCRMNTLLKCEDSVYEIFDCYEDLGDAHSFIKAVCLYHTWLSVFHSPVRLGIYKSLVHVIVVFFSKSVLFLGCYFGYTFANAYRYTMACIVVLMVTLVEAALEAFLRNTMSKFQAPKGDFFLGLVEPVESVYDLDNFSLDYDWDKVRPLLQRQNVILVVGTTHPSAYSFFKVPSPYSMNNMWGLFSEEEEREPLMILRLLNTCALPLPVTMKWLAIEATGRKEEVYIRQSMNSFKTQMCYFETWLHDWPFNFADDPHVAGLIISHILCRDLLMLLKVEDSSKIARMAQLCVHQWHGLICCIFLYIVQYRTEDMKFSVIEIKMFIVNTLTRFGKRTPKEIRAAWLKRNELRDSHRRKSLRDGTKGSSRKNSSKASSRRGKGSSAKISRTMDSDVSRDSNTSSMKPTEKLDIQKAMMSGLEVAFLDTLIFDGGASCSPLDSNENESRKKIEETAPLMSETEKSPEPDFNTNADARKQEDSETTTVELTEGTEALPMSIYERYFLGLPHTAKCIPVFMHKNTFRRHCDEIPGYCCHKKRCVLFKKIHNMVGRSCLEVLDTMMQDLLNFVLIPADEMTSDKIWKRKEMVEKMIGDLTAKADEFDTETFRPGMSVPNEGSQCNVLLTSIFNNMKQFIDTTKHFKKLNKKIAELEAKDPSEYRRFKRIKLKDENQRMPRCLFCAKQLKSKMYLPDRACDEAEKLVRFLSKGTIYVAEKEINLELVSRYTIQNYCATIVCHSREEIIMELEDPATVMSSHVLQAMIFSLLNDMLPKQTDFNELSADELRQLGTRLQRIKARYMTSDEERNRTREEKRRLEKIRFLIADVTSRWRMTSPQKALMLCAESLAQCLVQERILGISVYSGFISKEHEVLLNGDKERLVEIEAKATTAILKIARKVCEPIVKDVVYGTNDVDIIFPDKIREFTYTAEKLVLDSFLTDPAFLATCCYYIADIVALKVREFKMIGKYMNEYRPGKDSGDDTIPKNDRPYKFMGELILLEDYTHADIWSPVLRWGEVAIKGEPPLTREYIPFKYLRTSDGDHISEFFEMKKPVNEQDRVIAALLGARRGMDNYTKAHEYDKEKHLQHHLAKTQANLMDQIAEASQAVSQIFAMDRDHVSEFRDEQLFNVELYASGKLDLPFSTILGVIVLVIVAGLTLFTTIMTLIKGTVMDGDELKEWSLMCFIALLLYGGLFQPLKCLLYSIFKLYVD